MSFAFTFSVSFSASIFWLRMRFFYEFICENQVSNMGRLFRRESHYRNGNYSRAYIDLIWIQFPLVKSRLVPFIFKNSYIGYANSFEKYSIDLPSVNPRDENTLCVVGHVFVSLSKPNAKREGKKNENNKKTKWSEPKHNAYRTRAVLIHFCVFSSVFSFELCRTKAIHQSMMIVIDNWMYQRLRTRLKWWWQGQFVDINL